MPKFKVIYWWTELFQGEHEIEADSLDEVRERFHEMVSSGDYGEDGLFPIAEENSCGAGDWGIDNILQCD